MDKIKRDKINSIYNTNCSINIRDILGESNIEKKKKIMIKEYVKERIKNNKMNYLSRNRRPIEINKNCDYIINFSTNNIYYNNKNRVINKFKDNPHQYTICEYAKLTNDTYNDNYNNTITNYYNDYTQKTINNIKNRYPVIIISKKTKGKIKNIKNNNNLEKIKKIQANWRGYYLRTMAIGGIKKYIGFIALIKYIQKIYIKHKKILFLFYLKKINSNNNKCINIKKYFNKTIKTGFNNNRYENIKINNNNIIIEKLNYNSTSINIKRKSNNNKSFIYKPKKISTYLFNKNKNLYKNNIKIKNNLEIFITNINKIYIYKAYHFILYKLKKNQKLKQIINFIEKERIKKALNKFRENIINIKAKEEFYKIKNISITSVNNDNSINKLRNKEKVNPLLKTLINKKIERISFYKKHLLTKYFNIWFDRSIDIFKRSNKSLTERDKSKKKYIKIKYSHNIGFITDSSYISDQKEKSSISVNKSTTSRRKIMKIKSIPIPKNKYKNKINSSFKFEPRIEKMYKLINKMDNKKILNKYFVSWQKNN